MSSGNTTSDSTTQLSGRSRPVTKYDRVAIPLPLSKSKTNGHIKSAVKAVVDGQTKSPSEKPEQVEVTAKETGNGAEVIDGAVEANKTNGAQPETPASNGGDAADPTTPTHDLNNTLRKPAQLRTQLPPAFVPSNGRHTPQTADTSSSSTGSQVLPNANRAAKPAHIVFGSDSVFASDSSNNSSPIPPTHNAFPLPSRQPSRHSPHASVFIPPTHAHHISESYNNAYPYTPNNSHRPAQPSQSFVNHHYHSSRDSNLPEPSPRHYPGHAQINGRQMNGSNDFSSMPPSFQPYQFPAPILGRGPFDNAVALGSHISVMFLSTEFSDVQLQVVNKHDASSTTMAGHKLVLARSAPLYQLLSEGVKDSVLKISLPGKWHDLRAFQEALSWLYGCGLLGDAVSDVPFKVPGDSNSARLRYTLAYASAGLFLGISYISQRGVDISSSLLSWDNLHIALDFALEGGLHQSWSQGLGHNSGTSTPLNDPSATQLLVAIMDFMVASLPRDLSLDTSAPDLKELARLPEPAAVSNGSDDQASDRPVTHRSSRSVNDPRLSRIRFGELGGPSATARLISSILYSLPFPLLSILVQHPLLNDRIGPIAVANIARSVVTEREARRARILKQVPENKQHSNLHYVEVVKDDNGSPSGIRLSRQYIPAGPRV